MNFPYHSIIIIIIHVVYTTLQDTFKMLLGTLLGLYCRAFHTLFLENYPHRMIPLEHQNGQQIVHPTLDIQLYNGAHLVPGRVGNGVDLDGLRQYVSLGWLAITFIF